MVAPRGRRDDSSSFEEALILFGFPDFLLSRGARFIVPSRTPARNRKQQSENIERGDF